jgi:2-dehydro-3-deoxygluconokinase
MDAVMTSVACIGECMIELKQAERGLFSCGYGGDTLNTAVYLARLGAGADYITALGDDTLSDEMIAGWAAEGVGTKHVMRLKGKLPGLYMIETDDKGERRFFHWRESAAARRLMDLPETSEILDSLANYDVVYLSAITLSLYGNSGRARLFSRPWLARSECGPRCIQRRLRTCRYRTGFDRGSLAALSRRNQRKPAGAHSGRGGRAEAFRSREHPSSRRYFASDQG